MQSAEADNHRDIHGDNHGGDGAALTFERITDASLLIRLSGQWRLRHGIYAAAEVERQLAAADLRSVRFDSSGLLSWGSSLVAFLNRASELCKARGIEIDLSGAPKGARRLVELAEAVPERKGARTSETRPGLVTRVGESALRVVKGASEALAFIGNLTQALGNFAIGQARYRRTDFWLIVQDCGAGALGIVSLISFLVGVIVAYMGAVQLQKFGASIYVADLVGIGIVREMGAMMTGIIMAGRTGAAFAAQIGTMKVTQETDALTTLGLSPMEFLAVPRVLALVLMMPLLCVCSDLLGILGGAAIGTTVLSLSFSAYMSETLHAVTMGDFFGGLFKAATYGVLIALSGCLRGLQCGKSAAAVGDAATSAVVTGIVAIVVACGIYAVLFHVLGI